MAIFQSIALGKSRGSLGNVTTARVKGQNVAKEKIVSTTNVKSPAQVASRGKMSNAVLAYQYLAVFLSQAFALRKSTESIFNAFVRLTKNIYSDIVSDFSWAAANMIAGEETIGGNWFKIIAIVNGGGNTTVNFETAGLSYPVGARLRIIQFSPASGQFDIQEMDVTSDDWVAGGVVFPQVAIVDSDFYAYIYSADKKKITGIFCK